MQAILTQLRSSLGDRYRVTRQLGAGGMALVYLAEEIRHNREVAIKVIRPELAEAVGSERFLREIRVTASLSHRHIPPLLDSGDADGLLYFVMPYLEGATLRDRLQQEGRLGIQDSLAIARDIADALEYAHRIGVVHRDIKPSNVFLANGHALLGDFGIALTNASDQVPTTSSNTMLGTVEYMSPEQCTQSHDVDARTDLYSLGCVLYEMLAGEPPFVARTRVAIVAKQISDPAPSLSTLRGDVPASVDDIVQKCLAKAPGDRYKTARELREVLDATILDVQRGTSATRSRAVPSRNWAIGLGLTAAGVAAAILFSRAPEVPDLNADRVVVFPLADRGGGVPVGADVSIMIGNALVHTEPLSWIDGWEILSPEHRRDPNLLSAAEARSISIDRGARHYITGGVALALDSIAVRLVLHDAAGDSIVGQAAASGAVDDVTPDQLALRAVVQLLPALVDPEREIDVSYLMERDPAAVALWIAGDRAYRQARFANALDLYREAVEADSLLSMAALKGAQAASWSEQLEAADDLLRLGVRHDSVLPARYRAFASGLASYSSGDVAHALSSFREALAADPRWSEAWTAVGEVYWHLLPPDLGGADSAAASFSRAVLHDPDFSPPLVHLAEDAFRRGQLEVGETYLERLTSARGESLASMEWLTLMRDCAALVPGTAPDGRYFNSDAGSRALLRASRLLVTGTPRWDCAEAGFRELLDRSALAPGERWMAIVGLQSILTALGQNDELADLLDGALAEMASTNFLFAIDVLAGADLTQQAAAVDARAAQDWGPDFQAIGPLTTWLLSVWNAYERDLPTLDRLVARLDVLRAERGDPHTANLADAAHGHRALARGDSTEAVRIFSSLVTTGTRVGIDIGLSEPLAPERILLAELLLARGEAEEAYRVASVFDHPEPLIFVPFTARSLSIRLAAAQALSGPEWAQRAQEASDRLAALRLDRRAGEPGGSR